jgi:GH15 family glucan-1,4-alpha-glucosidase
VQWLLGLIEKTMEMADAGIWEYRTRTQHHCYTHLFHWAGSKAAMKIARIMADGELAARAEIVCARAIVKIEQCFSNDGGFYAQAIGVRHPDASSLQLIIMRYLDPASARAKNHLAYLERTLRTGNGLFKRYSHADDVGAPGSSFLVCSFWYAEALACVGEAERACEALERALKSANHLGLLSEDVDDDFGQWGNFPQTYCHVGLINAACRIAQRLDSPNFL